MATIRERRGRWQVIVQVRGADGRRRTESATFDTQAEAELHAHRLEYSVRSGELTPDRTTVAAVADAWLQLHRHRNQATVSAYAQALQRAVEQLGRIQARRLTTRDCDMAWAALLDDLSPTYVRQIRSVLSMSMAWAAASGIVHGNPVAGSKVRAPGRAGAALDEDAVCTPAELDRLLRWDGPSPWPLLWRLLADTGLRQGEARALRWADVDLDAGTVRVRATMTKDGSGERLGPPKSAASRRIVPLTAEAARVVAAHRSQVSSRYGLPFVRADAFVAAGTAGAPVARWQISERWRVVRAELGLRNQVVPHTLRHTYASTLLAEGVPLIRVAALLGHTPAVCARVYAHWAGGTDHAAVAMLERARQRR